MKCIFFKILRFVFTLLFAGYIYAKLKNNSMQYYIYIKIFVFIVFSIIFHILFNYAYYKDIKKVFNDWQILIITFATPLTISMVGTIDLF